MINIITGPPRAGKSFLCVYQLFYEYFIFDKEKCKYIPKNNALIISNVDDLKLPHRDFDKVLEDNQMKPEEYFTREVQEELSKKYETILYFLDEAHIYFPAELSRKSEVSESLRSYFAYHGHYNQHFWLMTQDCSLIYQPLVKLAEVEYQTVRASLSPPGRFMYNMRVPGRMGKFKSFSIKKDKRIFPLYKTAKNKETEKPKRTRAYMYFMIAVGFVAVSISFFIYSVATMGSRDAKNNTAGVASASEIPKRPVNKVAQYNNSERSLEVEKKNNYTWQKMIYVYYPAKKEIRIYDRVFGLIKLQDFEYEFKTVNGQIYALLPPPADTDDGQEAVTETEEKEIL